MTDPAALPLHEEVMLLALRNDTGTVEWGTWYCTAMGGAVLAELLLAERIRLKTRSGEKTSVVEVVSRDPTGIPLVDEWLAILSAEREPRTAATWVGRIAESEGLEQRVAADLEKKGILRMAEDKVLFVFSRTVYPEVDPRPEKALRERLRGAVLGASTDVDARTAVLVSLAKETELLPLVLDRKERKAHQARLDAVTRGEACGEAVQQLVQEATTTLIVASVVPLLMATSVINNN